MGRLKSIKSEERANSPLQLFLQRLDSLRIFHCPTRPYRRTTAPLQFLTEGLWIHTKQVRYACVCNVRLTSFRSMDRRGVIVTSPTRMGCYWSFSYSVWTATSLQWRLSGGISFKKGQLSFAFETEKTPPISLRSPKSITTPRKRETAIEPNTVILASARIRVRSTQ